MYLGVNKSTRAIKKKARSVFLSIAYISGSCPPGLRGLHLIIRHNETKKPIRKPFLFKASTVYWEQEGWKRQFSPKRGEMCFWYPLMVYVAMLATLRSNDDNKGTQTTIALNAYDLFFFFFSKRFVPQQRIFFFESRACFVFFYCLVDMFFSFPVRVGDNITKPNSRYQNHKIIKYKSGKLRRKQETCITSMV